MSGPDAPEQSGPVLRVVRGDPTPEELAALVTVVSTMAGAARDDAPRGRGSQQPSAWNHPARLVRRPLTPSPDAWRLSTRLG